MLLHAVLAVQNARQHHGIGDADPQQDPADRVARPAGGDEPSQGWNDEGELDDGKALPGSENAADGDHAGQGQGERDDRDRPRELPHLARQRRTVRAHDDTGSSARTGSLPSTVVPGPGTLRTSISPPRTASRSAMPCNPVP